MQATSPSPSLSPTIHPSQRASPFLSAHDAISAHDDELLLHDLALPSSRQNERAARKSPALRGKKARRRAALLRREGGVNSKSLLLNLPLDVLSLLLSRLAPRTLAALSATCSTLRADIDDDATWRRSYVHHFLGLASAVGSGASVSAHGATDEVRTLVRPCGDVGRGWRREALAREEMLDTAPGTMHHPPVDLIHHLSLYYPVYRPSAHLVVGKTRPAVAAQAEGGGDEADGDEADDVPSPSPTPRATHRQKYEAQLAATTRPAPHVLSLGLRVGGIVRSDPLSGKVSKGYWGPGRDANFHLRPHLDSSNPPVVAHLARRRQHAAVWGLMDGRMVYTGMSTRSHVASAAGGRASSVNVECAVGDAHEGPVECIDVWEGQDEMFVTGGTDGRVKVWRHVPPAGKGGKKSRAAHEASGRLECVYSSSPSRTPLPGRPESTGLRLAQAPDGVARARYDPVADVACGVTRDGELRVWFGVGAARREGQGLRPLREVRIDVGESESRGWGGVVDLELDTSAGTTVAVLVRHEGQPGFARYDASPDGRVERTEFQGGEEPISALHACLVPAGRIASAKPRSNAPTPGVATPLEAETPDVEQDQEPPHLDLNAPREEVYGQFVVTGDMAGVCRIYPWRGPGRLSGQYDGDADADAVRAIRTWEVGTPGKPGKRITCIDANASLVAIGSADGYIRVYDPLSSPPALLRALHAQHLSPGDAALIARGTHESAYLLPSAIVLEDDLLVASVGRKVFCFRTKGRAGAVHGKGKKGHGGRGYVRAMDLKSAQRDAAEDHAALRAQREAEADAAAALGDELGEGGGAGLGGGSRTRLERQVQSAMQRMGLEGADEDVMLQYAMMLSMEEGRDAGGADEVWEGDAGEEDGEYLEGGDDDEEGEDEAFGERRGDDDGQEDEDEDEDEGEDDDDGLSDGEREAIRAVQEFERTSGKAGGWGR